MCLCSKTFPACYFGLSTPTRPSLQKQTELLHSSASVKTQSREKQAEKMRWLEGKWSNLPTNTCVISCIFWFWLQREKQQDLVSNQNLITSLSAEEVSAHWQRSGRSTPALTLYLLENNNTRPLLSATGAVPVCGPTKFKTHHQKPSETEVSRGLGQFPRCGCQLLAAERVKEATALITFCHI